MYGLGAAANIDDNLRLDDWTCALSTQRFPHVVVGPDPGQARPGNRQHVAGAQTRLCYRLRFGVA